MTDNARVLGKLGISAVARGVWRLALPFPSPLGYSFSYLVRVDDGFVAIDLGWDTTDGYDLLQAGLARAGGALTDIRGVVVTHAHPDHIGLAEQVRQVSGCWLGMHPRERVHIVRDGAERQARVEQFERWLVRAGLPKSDRERIMSDRDTLRGQFPQSWPDVLLEDGDSVPGTGGGLVAIHTPGHTPGHLTFHDAERQLLYTGDHVLPRVTSNVSRRPSSDPDPLADYTASLTKLDAYGDTLVLPGHEWSFDDLDARLAELREHHDARMIEIADVVRSGAETVWEVANDVTWSRSFLSLDSRGIRSALGETEAHLVRLANESVLVQVAQEPQRWRIAG